MSQHLFTSSSSASATPIIPRTKHSIAFDDDESESSESSIDIDDFMETRPQSPPIDWAPTLSPPPSPDLAADNPQSSRAVREIRDNPGNTIGLSRGTENLTRTGHKSTFSGRRFQFTLNEPDKWEELKAYIASREFHYAVASRETAPETGHIHIHCYVHYKNSLKLYTSKCCGAHIEICKGSGAQNEAYIKKEGDIIWEEGENPKGYRYSKAITIKEAREMPWEQLDDTPASSYRHIKQVKDEALIKKWQAGGSYWSPVLVEWIYGATGTGKTRYCVQEKAVVVDYVNGFFTDWGDARVICLEEYRGGIPYGQMLQLLDDYHGHYIVNIKHSHKIIDLDKIIITSPLPPQDIFVRQIKKKDSILQLLRRIDKIICTDGDEWKEISKQEIIDDMNRKLASVQATDDLNNM